MQNRLWQCVAMSRDSRRFDEMLACLAVAPSAKEALSQAVEGWTKDYPQLTSNLAGDAHEVDLTDFFAMVAAAVVTGRPIRCCVPVAMHRDGQAPMMVTSMLGDMTDADCLAELRPRYDADEWHLEIVHSSVLSADDVGDIVAALLQQQPATGAEPLPEKGVLSNLC